MRVLIVDDHVLFSEGLASLLNAQPDFSVVGQAGSVGEAIILARELCPDLILMDFGLPDGTGLEATQAILAERPTTMIVFLTVHEQDERLFAAIRSGAKGYLLKNVPVAKLLAHLRGLERGEAAISPTMTSHILGEFARMSPAHESSQVEASNREIADRLCISENTVKNHVGNILAKLDLRNRREAASFARRYRLINASSEHLPS
jgi:DNA-binding NarL/FixJ family response regulator